MFGQSRQQGLVKRLLARLPHQEVDRVGKTVHHRSATRYNPYYRFQVGIPVGQIMAPRYPQPDNESGFEQLCLRHYRKVWKNECLALYAKRGENQDGVDIFDPLNIRPIRAVQCKHHEPTKQLSKSEIQKEVEKAEKSQFGIEHYVIATTAQRSRTAHDTVSDLNLRSSKKFTVEIHFWDEICQSAFELGPVVAEIIIYGQRILAGASFLPQASEPPEYTQRAETSVVITDDKFGVIESLLAERRFEVVRYELDKFGGFNLENALTSEQRYKLLRLRGKLELETGHYEAASRFFLQAFENAPTLVQAKQNQVLAYALVGDQGGAFALACKYVCEGIKTPIMVLRLVENTPSLAELDEHTEQIADLAASDVDVITALSDKYSSFGDFARGLKAAEHALGLAPQSAHAHLAAAFAHHNASRSEGVPDRSSSIRQSLIHYDSAARIATEARLINLLPEIYSNRANAKMTVGDPSGAESDFREAVRVAVHPAVYAERAVAHFLNQEAYQTAREFVSLLAPQTLEARYLTLVTEYHTKSGIEKSRCISEMNELADESWDRSVECRFQCVQWAIDANELNLAASFASAPFEEAHPFQAQVMLAWVRLVSHDRDSARLHALNALESSIREAHTQEVRLLARILVALKEDAKAVNLLEQVVMPGVLNEDMKGLLRCASRLRRDDLLLRLCRELRSSGPLDPQLQRLEMDLLNRYAPREALVLAEELVQTSSDPNFYAAYRNMIAVRVNELQKIDLESVQLPTAAQLSPNESSLIIVPYVALGMHTEALRFLYAQLRLNFDNEDSHSAYIFLFLKFEHLTQLSRTPEEASEDSAVLLELGTGEQQWAIVENTQPVPSRGEFSSNSSMGRALLGHSVEDLVELPGNHVQPQSATIRELQSKYLRAFQDSFHNLIRRFPGTTALQQVNVGEGEDFDPGAMVEAIKRRHEHIEHCMDIYRTHPCSLYLLAERIGNNEYETQKTLSGHAKGFVRCCQISPHAFDAAVGAELGAGPIVLSASAIATLSLLDGWNCLHPSRRYLVSQMTSDVVDDWLREWRHDRPHPGGYMSVDDFEQLVFQEATVEERISNHSEVFRIKQKIAMHCEIMPSLALAAIDPEKRKLCSELVGLHNLDSMTLAKAHNGTLWTDDFVVGIVATADFCVPSVWTQLAVRCLAEANLVAHTQYDLISAKLAGWRYANTMWNAATIIAAGRHAEWRTNGWPFVDCIQLLANPGVPTLGKVRIVRDFLKLLRHSDCSEFKQSAVIQALLDQLNNPYAVRWIKRQLDNQFGVDIPSAKFLRLELDYWLRLR